MSLALEYQALFASFSAGLVAGLAAVRTGTASVMWVRSSLVSACPAFLP